MRLAMKKENSDPIASSIIFQFLLAGITFLFALTQGYSLPPLSLLPVFLASGMLYAVGTIAYFFALKTVEASESSILSSAGIIATILASFLFLHDRLTILQLFGVFLILCSVVIIHAKKHMVRLPKGAWLVLAGTGTYGCAVVIDSYIIKRYDAVSFLPLISFIPGMLILLIYFKRIPSILKEIRQIDTNLVIFISLYALQAITFYLALQHGALVSQASAVARASIILTVLFATIFLKESKHIGRKCIAAILTTIGVLLVTT